MRTERDPGFAVLSVVVTPDCGYDRRRSPASRKRCNGNDGATLTVKSDSGELEQLRSELELLRGRNAELERSQVLCGEAEQAGFRLQAIVASADDAIIGQN